MSALKSVAEHTTGPWKAARRIEVHDDSHLNEIYFSIDLDTANQQGLRQSAYIARVDGMRGERLEANALLIAAAPELLAACERALVIVRDEEQACGCGVGDQLEVAIRKAKGAQ